MPRNARSTTLKKPVPHFMRSTAASRAQKNNQTEYLRQSPGATPATFPISRRNQFVNRFTQRLASLSNGKPRSTKLPIPSPPHTRVSPWVLSSPTRCLSHIPEPVKKGPPDSPASKPLPSLPVASFIPTTPINRRSLLDAIEKPLRRSVSPGMFEDWPVLSPKRKEATQTIMRQQANMDRKVDLAKPNQGESVIEMMGKFHVDDNDDDGKTCSIPRISSRAQLEPRNHTLKTDNSSFRTIAGSMGHRAEASAYLNPRLGPGTARGQRPERGFPISRLGRQASLRSLDVLETRRSPNLTDQQEEVLEVAHRKPASNDATQIWAIAGDQVCGIPSRQATNTKTNAHRSSIPRLARISSATESPCPNREPSASRAILLKHAQGNVSDMMQTPSNTAGLASQKMPDVKSGRDLPSPSLRAMQRRPSSAGEGEFKSQVRAATLQGTCTQREPCGEDDRGRQASSSSDDTIKQTASYPAPSTPIRCLSMKENIPPTDEQNEKWSLIRDFKFPASPIEEDKEDSESDLTCVTSISGASKAATIYAQDENGGYRLKPVSKRDPKNGPRVRIEDSADRLLLGEGQLAQIHAKREAYSRKYSLNRSGSPSAVVPELESLHPSPEEVSHGADADLESTIPATWMDPAAKPSRDRYQKLAPSIPANIPTLAHSQTGCTLLGSTITPFAPIDSTQAGNRRKSASESNVGGHPTTPQRYGADMVEESPATAYTIRTALQKVAHIDPPSSKGLENARARKSLRNMSSRSFFPPRISSKKELAASLRKQSSGLLPSYVNQRAEFSPPDKRHVSRSDRANVKSHPVTNVIAIPPPKCTQSCQDTDNHRNSCADVSPISSADVFSQVAATGSTQTGKAKMMNTMRSLFPKSSKEGSVARSESQSWTTVSAKEAHKPSTLRVPMTPEQLSYLSHSISTGSASSPTNSNTNAGARGKLRFNPKPKRHRSTETPHNATSSSSPSHPFTGGFVTSALEPPEIRDATGLAFSLLDRARGADRRHSGLDVTPAEERLDRERREGYVKLAKVLVSVVSMARDAEKAVEEARVAARKAEMEGVKTRRAVGEVCGAVQQVLRGDESGREGEKHLLELKRASLDSAGSR